MLPVLQALLPRLTTPGNKRQLMMGLDKCRPELLTTGNTPVAIKRLDVISPVEIDHFLKCLRCSLVIPLSKSGFGEPLLLLKGGHVVPELAVDRSEERRVGK